MIKLYSLKQEKKDRSDSSQSFVTAAKLRVKKDIADLNLPTTCKTFFPDKDDLLNFKLIISPDDGYYRGGEFAFSFRISNQYPHEPPKIRCDQTIYHPNIDLDGNVCLNILREDWNPVLSLNSIVYGLQHLFLEPNADDPLNQEAADLLNSNIRHFEHNVLKAMKGGYIGNTYYDRCLRTY